MQRRLPQIVLRVIVKMALAPMFGRMVINIQVHGKMVYVKVKVFIGMVMAINMMACMLMI